MNKLFIYIAVMAIAILTSCEKEEVEQEEIPTEGNLTIIADHKLSYEDKVFIYLKSSDRMLLDRITRNSYWIFEHKKTIYIGTALIADPENTFIPFDTINVNLGDDVTYEISKDRYENLINNYK